MKHIFLVMLCLMSLGTFAQSYLPEEMSCTSTAKSDSVREFTITKINSGRPELSLDGNWMVTDITGDTFKFGFSNECDNDFGVQFKKNDLRNLQIEKVQSITGQLEYWVSDLGSEHEDEEGNLREVVTITCRKIK